MALPTWVVNLQARRDEITAELAAIDNTSNRTQPGSKPDVGGDAGGTEGTAYRMSLIDELTKINEVLKKAADVIAAEEIAEDDGPFSIEQQVRT